MRAKVLTCRGAQRAERHRALRTDQWWKAANEKSLPFRIKIVEAIEELKQTMRQQTGQGALERMRQTLRTRLALRRMR